MTEIKLYDSAINAINGQSNPAPQSGNVQNLDIQDILEMVRNGQLEEAIKLLDQAGITSMISEDNSTKVLNFEFENRKYTIRYNPVSEDVQNSTPADSATTSSANNTGTTTDTSAARGTNDTTLEYIQDNEAYLVCSTEEQKNAVLNKCKELLEQAGATDTLIEQVMERMKEVVWKSDKIPEATLFEALANCGTKGSAYTVSNYTYNDIIYTAESVDLFDGRTTAVSADNYEESVSPTAFTQYQKLCEYLGVEYKLPSEFTRAELGVSYPNTPIGRLDAAETYARRKINEVGITLEQALYINSHPEEFYGLLIIWGKVDSDNKIDYISMQISTKYTDAMRIKNGELSSQEDVYDRYIDKFASRLHDDTKGEFDTYKEPDCPIYNVKLNGDNVEFTENTVSAIKKYLESTEYRAKTAYKGPSSTPFMQLFGFEFGDDEQTIWAKINAFCEKHGSTDGVTISLKDYYDEIAENEVDYVDNSTCQFADGSYVPSGSRWPTYKQCGIIIDDYVNGLKAWCEEIGMSYLMDGVQRPASAETPAKTPSVDASQNSKQYSPTMSIGGVYADSPSVEKAYEDLKQETMKEFLMQIQQFGNEYSYQAPSFFGEGDLPIFALDTDANGNIIIGDKFKKALKDYLQSLVDAEKADLERYDKVVAETGMGTNYIRCCQTEFIEMLGLTDIPYSNGKHESMYAWLDDIQSYIDDDSKMEQLVAAYCNSIGSTDGKTVSVEQYYFALANNDIYEAISTFSQRRRFFKKEEDLRIEAEVNAYLAVLQEEYPEVYKEYGNYIQCTSTTHDCSIKYKDGLVRGDVLTDDEASGEEVNDIRAVLRIAAGITDDESYGEKAAKMKALLQTMGAQGNLLEIDIRQMINYLLGDNAEGINYFDKLKAQYYATINAIENTPLEKGVSDASIPVEVYEEYDIYKDTSENTEAPEISEISDFIENLLDPIYAKYFVVDNAGQYINFVLGESDWNNPDSGDYVNITWAWRDNAMKEAFAKEVEAVIAKVMEKYSDIITSIMFDGQQVIFTTIYDNDNPNSYYAPINEVDYISGATALNGLAHGVSGNINIIGSIKGQTPSKFEAAVDTPIVYSSAPNVVSNNIPENAPVGVIGEPLCKTAWDGIWVSVNGNYIYLWDSKEQKYHAVDMYGSADAKSFAAGIGDFPYGRGFDIDNILISLVYGYNRTDTPYIFEKDGKFYAYDVGTKYHRPGFKGLEEMLNEVEIYNNTDNTTQASKKQNLNITSLVEETTEDTILLSKSSFAADSKDSTEEITAGAEEAKDIDVTIKSEEWLEEMEDAAQKLGLTSAKTTGLYYKFTKNGTYLYIWNPNTKKFQAFSINVRNADGTIDSEFTQNGRAKQRTEKYLYYEALLEAYKNGYNFTVNFPWLCEKDGVFYEYDKENGCFKKKS